MTRRTGKCGGPGSGRRRDRRRSGFARGGFGVAFAACVWGAAAHAQAPAPETPSAPSTQLLLTWEAPESCPTQAEVRAEARRALGAGAEPSSPLVAHARVESRGERHELHLVTQFEGQRGERRLAAHDCRALVHSVTLTLAVLLGVDTESEANDADATAAAGAAPTGGAASAASATATAAQSAPAAPAQQTASTEAEDSQASNTGSAQVDEPRPFSLLLGPALQLGLAPRPAFAVALGAELGFGTLSIGVRFHYMPAREDEVSASVTTRTGAVGGALSACGRWPLGKLGLGVCGGAQAAAVRAEASGAAIDPDSAVAPWYALTLGGDLSWPYGATFAVRLWAEAAASLARPTFVVEGLGESHRVAPVVGQLGLGLVCSP